MTCDLMRPALSPSSVSGEVPHDNSAKREVSVDTATRTYHFDQVDVFTERPFGGNPLAVFLDARGLSDAEMHAIATEMNLSETTFVLPPTRPDCAARVRIFTPRRELPFAGHPTLGSAYVLATNGLLPLGTGEVALEEGVGPVMVRIEGDYAAPTFLWMRHPAVIVGSTFINRQDFARALGLTEQDLLANAPIEASSTGAPHLYVPLVDAACVDHAVLDVPALLEAFGSSEPLGVVVFAPDPDPTAGRVYTRMFAPHTIGVPEDPATGGASGPLGEYLVRHGLVAPRGAALRIVSEQGTKMGRQSFVHIAMEIAAGTVHHVDVGGSVRPMISGVLRLPKQR